MRASELPRPDDIDRTTLPLPANLSPEQMLTYKALLVALNERDALHRQAIERNQQAIELRTQLLDMLCPVVDGGDLPIERNVLVDVNERSLHLVEDPKTPDGRLLKWTVEGPRVSFKDGVKTEGRPVEVDQSTYEALPTDIKAQTRASIRAATPLAVNLKRPLSWTEPMASMFQHIKETFQGTAPDAVVRLPSAVWNHESDTRRIYLNMVKQGVIELATSPKGQSPDPSAELRHWWVQRGPRYEAFVNALAEEHARLRVEQHAKPRSRRPR